MVEPLCLNFRGTTANFSGVRIFRNFTIIQRAPSKFSDQTSWLLLLIMYFTVHTSFSRICCALAYLIQDWSAYEYWIWFNITFISISVISRLMVMTGLCQNSKSIILDFISLVHAKSLLKSFIWHNV